MTKNMLRSSTTWVYCNSERFSKVTQILLLLNNAKCSIHYESIGERMLLYTSTTVQCTMNTPECHPTSIIELVGESSRPYRTTSSTFRRKRLISLWIWSMKVWMYLDGMFRTVKYLLPRQRLMPSFRFVPRLRSRSLARILVHLID